MLSRDFRTIFIHIPKTGGQSIETVFVRRHGLTWETRAPLLLRSNPDPLRGPRRLAHLYASEYVAFGHVTADEFQSFFKFAVVRNPWARAVSSFKYMFQNTGMPFGMFAEQVVGQGRFLTDRRQFEPQVRYVCGEDGGRIVDRVLRFENLTAEFAEVSRRIFGEAEELPRVNVSRDRTDYRNFYDDVSRRLVEQIYRDDIEAFGYRFDDVQ